jgi:hypothetical protein
MGDLLVGASVVLAVLAFLALGFAAWALLRRAGQLVAETRDLEVFQAGAQDLTERIIASFDGLAGRVDAVRRRALATNALDENIAASAEAIARYLAETRELRTPGPALPIRDAIEGELGRAARAIEMIEHGCVLLSAGRTRGREIEGQTSIKRGYLNLLHAREAIAVQGARAAELRPVRASRLLNRSRPGGSAVPDHRM